MKGSEMNIENEVDWSWFIRDDIHKEIKEVVDDIAQEVLCREIDFMNDFDAVLECIGLYVPDFDKYTSEEFELFMQYIYSLCTLIKLTEKGLVEKEGDKYKLTMLGKAVASQI